MDSSTASTNWRVLIQCQIWRALFLTHQFEKFRLNGIRTNAPGREQSH